MDDGEHFNDIHDLKISPWEKNESRQYQSLLLL